MAVFRVEDIVKPVAKHSFGLEELLECMDRDGGLYDVLPSIYMREKKDREALENWMDTYTRLGIAWVVTLDEKTRKKTLWIEHGQGNNDQPEAIRQRDMEQLRLKGTIS